MLTPRPRWPRRAATWQGWANRVEPKEDGPGKKAEAACSGGEAISGSRRRPRQARGQGRATEVPRVEGTPWPNARQVRRTSNGEAKVSCEGGEISGKCDAECKGNCTVEAGAKCEGSCGGTCEGSCEANFAGKCDGNCNGKCDGKDTKGKCAGTCDGKCEGSGKGSCSGTCKGSCSASAPCRAGKVQGTCSGGCSVDFKEPSALAR